jgi:ATP-dependent DNA helicase RecG
MVLLVSISVDFRPILSTKRFIMIGMNDTELTQNILLIPEETQTIEFKRLNGDRVVSKIIETMVAMANTDGGRIIVGIDDPEKTKQKGVDRVYGLEENFELFDEIIHDAKRVTPPLVDVINPLIIKVPEVNKSYAIFTIPKASEAFHSIDNNVFIRLNKSNKRLTPQELIKMNYAKGFTKADRELVEVDFDLLNTEHYDGWRRKRKIPVNKIEDNLFHTGLARKNETGKLLPTRAAVLLFAEYPTDVMETKCAIRILQYEGTIETYGETPNMVGVPMTINGPLNELINEAHIQLMSMLRSGIEIRSGFVTKYKIPERAINEAITNAVIHRDYHIKKDIEIKIFEDRVEVRSPGLFPYNITTKNIGRVRADGYRNDLIVKHLREFPNPPNLDQSEGVKAIQSEMKNNNLYPAVYWTYPMFQDAVEIGLFNEVRSTEWDKVKEYLQQHKYINNQKAREITGVTQLHTMSRFLSRWTTSGLLTKIEPSGGGTRLIRYKLSNSDDIENS